MLGLMKVLLKASPMCPQQMVTWEQQMVMWLYDKT